MYRLSMVWIWGNKYNNIFENKTTGLSNEVGNINVVFLQNSTFAEDSEAVVYGLRS